MLAASLVSTHWMPVTTHPLPQVMTIQKVPGHGQVFSGQSCPLLRTTGLVDDGGTQDCVQCGELDPGCNPRVSESLRWPLFPLLLS